MINQTEYQIFSQNIACLRKAYRLSKKEMAKRLGIGVGSLTKIERGEIPARLGCQVIIRASATFGIRPAALFERILSLKSTT